MKCRHLNGRYSRCELAQCPIARCGAVLAVESPAEQLDKPVKTKIGCPQRAHTLRKAVAQGNAHT